MAKRLVLYLCISFFTFHLCAEDRPKVGLVLSGGGAKGFAHVGVLKVLEELGIPIDYIGGTSIGSIIGGLYAIGYNADDIESFIQKQDWEFLLSDEVDRGHIPYFEKLEMDRYNISLPVKWWRVEVPNNVIKGQNVINKFSELTFGYHDITDFSQFKIPFFCVAADLETGKEILLDHGYLPECMKASMAIPGVFRPQEIEGYYLVDGGVINNFPVDRMKEMGADIIIGVDLSSGLKKKEELNSIGSVMGQLVSVMGLTKYEANKQQCDIYMNPDLHEFTASSFTASAADTMFIRGEQAAYQVYEQLLELRKQLGTQAPPKKSMKTPSTDTTFVVKNIVYEGRAQKDHFYLEGKLGLQPNSEISLDDINNGIANLYGTLNYELISYRLVGGKEKTLILNLSESSKNTLNMGVHYDNVNHAAMLLNTTFRKGAGSGARISANLKLSRLPGFDIQYTVDRGVKPGFEAGFEYHNLNFTQINEDQDFIVDLDFSRFWLGTHIVAKDRFTLGLGLFSQNTIVKDIYTNNDSTINASYYSRGTDITYRMFINFDNRDNIYYPTKGTRFVTEFRVITDNLYEYKNQLPILSGSLAYQKSFKLGRRFTMHPSAYGRFTYATYQVPTTYQTFIGGTLQTDYFNSQIPFYGMRFLSYPVLHAAVGAFRTDFEFLPKNHVGAIFNMGFYSQDNSFVNNTDMIYGIGLNYSYDTFIGPFDVWITASNQQRDLYTFLSIGYWF